MPRTHAPRVHRATPIALVFSMLAALPAQAALITDVADAADGDDPLDFNIDVKWRREQRAGKITREFFDQTSKQTLDVTELRYNRWTHILDTTLTIGLYHDLELHGRIPYALADEQYWGWAKVNGQYVRESSTIERNQVNADNVQLAQPTPLLPVDGRVYRGGFLDPSIGFAWAIFNGEREDKLPAQWFPHKVRTATLVLGFDYTIPLIDVVDPRVSNPKAPDSTAGFPLGVGAHRFDFWTAMSKRVGIVEPFIRLHYTLSTSSSKVYDNCAISEPVQGSADPQDPQNLVMSSHGKTSCRNDPFWADKTDLEFPHVGGITFGTEFIPVEEPDGSLRLAIGLQLAADYVSRGRRASELSDALRKYTYTDQYFALDSRLTFDLRFSKYVHLVSYLSLGTDTPHLLTSETVGKDRHGRADAANPDELDGVVELLTNEMNPNYDQRIDQPGGRFKITEVSVFAVSSMLSINF